MFATAPLIFLTTAPSTVITALTDMFINSWTGEKKKKKKKKKTFKINKIEKKIKKNISKFQNIWN